MNREEFLQKLQEALSGTVPPETVQENLRYYSRYLRDERQKGRSEQEILDELGDPRLIARTIIDTTPGAGEGNFEPYTGGGFGFGGFDRSDAAEETETADEDSLSRKRGSIHYYDLNKWYWKLLAVVIVIAVITLVIAVVSGLLSLLVPLMPVILAVAFLMWMFQH